MLPIYHGKIDYMTKICKECGKEKDISEYRNDKTYRDGKIATCKKCESIYHKIYREKNKKSLNSYGKKWRKENKEKYREYVKQCYQENMKDIGYRLLLNCRTRFRIALKNIKTIDRHKSTIGCTVEELKKHLKSQFRDGMSWDNYGLHGWHIDHIKPLRAFDLTDPEQQKRCFHYSNLQPLWWYENLEKHNKLDFKVV